MDNKNDCKKQSIVYKGWNAYGDYLTYSGLIRHFLDYYDEVQVICDCKEHIPFLERLFCDVTDRVVFRKFETYKVDECTDIADSLYEHFGLFTNQGRTQFHNNNPFPYPGTQTLDIEHFEKNNAMHLYKDCFGVLSELRITKFFYQRDMEEELKIKNQLLAKHNVQEGEPYIVSNGYYKNDLPNMKVVNINDAVDMPLHLLKTIEDSYEAHMIDNMLLLLTFYTQSSGIIQINHPIHYFISARYRGEYVTNMMCQPLLPHWVLHRDPWVPIRD